MTPQQTENIERVLADYADWAHRGGSITDGYPRRSIGAAESRIHSIEDIEDIEDNRVMLAVHSEIYELSPPQCHVIMRRFGLQSDVWRRPREQQIYEGALEQLHKSLKTKIVL